LYLSSGETGRFRNLGLWSLNRARRLRSRRASRKRQQRNVARALDGHAEPALVTRTNSGHPTRQNLAAFLHELRKNVRALIVDEVHLLDAELAHFLLAEILPLAAARSARSAWTSGTTWAAFTAAATSATRATFTTASAASGGMPAFAPTSALAATLTTLSTWSTMSTRAAGGRWRTRAAVAAFTYGRCRGSLSLLLFL
jgi:hypothetical protein